MADPLAGSYLIEDLTSRIEQEVRGVLSKIGSLGGMFSKKAVLALLSRADAEYLRYYHARDEKGQRTIVLVAADSAGSDLLDGPTTALDQHYPCPPYCPTEASALRG